MSSKDRTRYSLLMIAEHCGTPPSEVSFYRRKQDELAFYLEEKGFPTDQLTLGVAAARAFEELHPKLKDLEILRNVYCCATTGFKPSIDLSGVSLCLGAYWCYQDYKGWMYHEPADDPQIDHDVRTARHVLRRLELGYDDQNWMPNTEGDEEQDSVDEFSETGPLPFIDYQPNHLTL